MVGYNPAQGSFMAKRKAKPVRHATPQQSVSVGRPAPRRRRRRATRLSKLNQWLIDEHADLIAAAKQDCLRMTGKLTFGSAQRRKSA
jgi:hypothetical protein